MTDDELDTLLTNAKPLPMASGYSWIPNQIAQFTTGFMVPEEVWDLLPNGGLNYETKDAANAALREAVAKFRAQRTGE